MDKIAGVAEKSFSWLAEPAQVTLAPAAAPSPAPVAPATQTPPQKPPAIHFDDDDDDNTVDDADADGRPGTSLAAAAAPEDNLKYTTFPKLQPSAQQNKHGDLSLTALDQWVSEQQARLREQQQERQRQNDEAMKQVLEAESRVYAEALARSSAGIAPPAPPSTSSIQPSPSISSAALESIASDIPAARARAESRLPDNLAPLHRSRISRFRGNFQAFGSFYVLLVFPLIMYTIYLDPVSLIGVFAILLTWTVALLNVDKMEVGQYQVQDRDVLLVLFVMTAGLCRVFYVEWTIMWLTVAVLTVVLGHALWNVPTE